MAISFSPFTILLLSCVFTFSTAYRTPWVWVSRKNFPRQLHRSQEETVRVSQRTTSGISTTTFYPGQCIPIRNASIPTTIHLEQGSRNPYTLVTFSSSCYSPYSQEISKSKISIGNSIEVNQRFPICSFILEHVTHQKTPATVIFHKYKFPNPVYTATVSDRRCVNICAPSSSSWTMYADMLQIQVNGRKTSNRIKVFKDAYCSKLSISDYVKDGDNLAALTQTSGRIVQSFTIFR